MKNLYSFCIQCRVEVIAKKHPSGEVKNAKKRPKAFNFLIQISKNRCVINATAAPLIREIKTTLAVVTCTSFI